MRSRAPFHLLRGKMMRMSLIARLRRAHISQKLDDLFGVDVRSLALTRIGLSLTVLADLWIRASSLTFYIGEHSVMPSSLLYSIYPLPWSWSFHAWTGMSDAFLIALCIIHAGIALSVLIGYRTRLATIALFVFTVSLQHANPFVLQGGDTVQLLIIFMCIFLPWGAAFSVDRLLSSSSTHPERVLSGWSAALLLQIGFVYLFTALLKTGPEWTQSGTAVYYALSSGITQTWLGSHLLAFPALLTVLTVLVLLFEGSALFLLFSPVETVRVRSLTVTLLICMHTAFMLCLRIGLFSFIAISGLLAFIPTRAWEYFGHRNEQYPMIEPRQRLSTMVSVLGICFIVYVFTLNIAFLRNPESVTPGNTFTSPANIFSLHQRWRMYAPSPNHFNGWHAARARTQSGAEIDLLRNGSPYSENPPVRIADLYTTERDRKYMLSLVQQPRISQRVMNQYGSVLCERWNASHADHVTHIDVLLLKRDTVLPGAVPTETTEYVVSQTDCPV